MCGGIRALGRAAGDLYEPFNKIPSSLKIAALGGCYYYSNRQDTLVLAAIFTVGALFFKCFSRNRPLPKAHPLPPATPNKQNPKTEVKKTPDSDSTSDTSDLEAASDSDSDYIPPDEDSESDSDNKFKSLFSGRKGK